MTQAAHEDKFLKERRRAAVFLKRNLNDPFPAGVAMLGVPEPTLATKAWGLAAILHGVDEIWAGYYQAWTGRRTQNLTERAIQWELEGDAGMNRPQAAQAAENWNSAFSLAFSLGTAWGANYLCQLRRVELVTVAATAPLTPAARNAAQFEALAQRRVQLGLPAAGAAEDAGTLACLEINGQTFNGINRGLQNPPTPMTLQRVNAQTITHAEADVVQQAVNGGMRATARRAEMWVDRDPCGACGPSGGLRSLARNLGVDELIVHSPSGTQIFTPTR